MDSYLVAKELEETFRPTLLFTIVFTNGISVYLTKANDLTQAGWGSGVTYQGHRYSGHIVRQSIASLQFGANLGIDVFGGVQISVQDVRGAWLAYEAAFGFQGAIMTAVWTLYDVETNTFAPDSKVVFRGMCDAAQKSATSLSINAVSTYALTKSISPPVPIQRSCPWFFPGHLRATAGWFSKF